ncbi:hypothetical protein [Portibacter lacus]|nr:hypothetical protein [Portibacter lacus]
MNELLNRYFEGESSLEDEKALKAYFAGEHVAEEHKIYSDLFRFFNAEAEIEFTAEDSFDLLLEKYFEGETTIAEEQRLKHYYKHGDVADEHKQYADLFAFFQEEAEVTFDAEDSTSLLLEKYFAGETSIAEEQRLKSYFNSDDVAEEHKQYGELFGYFSIAQTEVLEKKIDLKEAKTLHIVRRTMMGIAAGLALVLGSLFVMNSYQDYQEELHLAQIEEAEAQEALETTMEALAYLGIQFNKGTESLEKMKAFKKTEIFKN